MYGVIKLISIKLYLIFESNKQELWIILTIIRIRGTYADTLSQMGICQSLVMRLFWNHFNFLN